MNASDVVASLRKLAKAIPSFAPNFDDQEVCEVWLEIIRDEQWTSEQIAYACKTASKRCKTFPAPAELIGFVNGSSLVSDKALAQQLAEGIWSRISVCSPYYNPDEFFNGLSEPQKAILGTPQAVRGLSDLTNSDRTTMVAQWRTALEGYLHANSSTREVKSLRAPMVKDEAFQIAGGQNLIEGN